MFKLSSSITDFFRPIAQIRSTKRPSPDADIEEQPHQKRRLPPENITGESGVIRSGTRDHDEEGRPKCIAISRSSLAQAHPIANGCWSNDSVSQARKGIHDGIAVEPIDLTRKEKNRSLESVPSSSQLSGVATSGSNSAKADSISKDCCSDDSVTEARSPGHGHNEHIALEPVDLTRKEKIGPLESVPRSSQRVVKHGEVIIRSSDDESDSDSSLDDIDGLLAQKSVVFSTPPTESDIASPPEAKQIDKKIRASTRGQKMDVAVASIPRLLPSFRMPPEYEFSLESLVQRTKDEKALEENMAKARWSLDSHEQEKSLNSGDSYGSAWTGATVDKTLLASVMKKNSEGDDIDRLMMAVQRTEALNLGTTWSFFDDMQSLASLEQAEPAIPNGTQWQGILSDTISREQSFLQGYIGEIASKENLPEELLMWIIDAVCIEAKDDLRNSYIYTLQEARSQVTTVLTTTLIEGLFQRAGASAEAVDIRSTVTPVAAGLPDKHEIPRSKLLPVLNLLNCVSAYLDVDSRTYVICMLCRLLLDISVVRSCETNAAIKNTFSSLVGCISEETQDQELRSLSTKIYPFVQDLTLRVQMLQNIPASSLRLSILRRRLSLAFFFEDENYLRKKQEDPIGIKLISRQLRKPRFKIRNDTNYTELAALIALLNIGFDSGDPPLPGGDKQTVYHFNTRIDMLSSSIHAIFTHIVDTGASHMRRTEAKQVLELFHSKLSYDIRTKPKPKTMIFESSKSDGDKKSMRKFLNRGAQKAP